MGVAFEELTQTTASAVLSLEILSSSLLDRTFVLISRYEYPTPFLSGCSSCGDSESRRQHGTTRGSCRQI